MAGLTFTGCVSAVKLLRLPLGDGSREGLVGEVSES